MPRRTIFLDVIDPSLPDEVQHELDARLRDLSGFKELRPPLWKRLYVMLPIVARKSQGEDADTVLGDVVNCVATGCELASVIECGVGCVCI